MKILIVIPTKKESDLIKIESSTHLTERFICDAGPILSGINTTFHLQKNNYDLILNLGIAGAYKESGLKIGDVVNINVDCFADTGIFQNNNIETLNELGFCESGYKHFNGDFLFSNNNLMPPIRTVRGITVNTINREKNWLNILKEKYSNEVETMEGASLLYISKLLNVPFLNIRGVSNYIEDEEKEKWNINSAIENLNTTISKFLKEI